MAKARALPFVDPDASLFVHAAVSIGTRLDELVSFEPYLTDSNSVYELHQMRIAAKRLRYTMDLFQSAFDDFSRHGKEFSAAVTEVKLLQEHLGNIHDADVLAPKLAAQLRKLLAAAHGNDKHGEPLVGVHLVDFDACQGLLSLCVQTRNARDDSFELLKLEWARMTGQSLFDQWRKLLRKAITDETLAEVLHEPLPSSTFSDQPTVTEIETETGTETNTNTDSAPEIAAKRPRTHVRRSTGASDAPAPAQNIAVEVANEKPGESRNGQTARARAGRKSAGADA